MRRASGVLQACFLAASCAPELSIADNQLENMISHAYKEGVAAKAPDNLPEPIYLEPDDFDMLGGLFKKSPLEAMRDAIPKDHVAHKLNGFELVNIYVASVNILDGNPKAPQVVQTQVEGDDAGTVKVNFVNVPEASLFEPQRMAEILSNNNPEILKAVPGIGTQWARFVGVHEGEHTTTHIDDYSGPNVLRHEVEADRAAIEYAGDNNMTDLVSAFTHYRSLAAADDPEHATGPFIGDDAKVAEMSDMEGWYQAAKNFEGTMLEIVQAQTQDRDINSIQDAREVMEKDPDFVLKIVQEALENGAFDNVPKQKAYITEYLDAYQSVIKEDHDSELARQDETAIDYNAGIIQTVAIGNPEQSAESTLKKQSDGLHARKCWTPHMRQTRLEP